MKAIEVAKKLAQLGAVEDACRAYILALNESQGEDFSSEMEAAAYLLEFGKGDDYKVAYTYFVKLYNHGVFTDTVLDIMNEAFYEPNLKQQKTRYEKNCKLLGKYPYFFRQDFPRFEDLPIHFYPYDDNGFLPFYPGEKRFGEYINFNNQVISRNFFKDLENPILAKDVFSQYELEYLKDNVRDSMYIARENHVYLHYSKWEEFCAHLCVLNFRQILEGKKIVFLVEDEVEQYPIDFKERYGIDYSQYTVKPIGIREVNRIIWHTQLSSHNGGDFFNEVFDNHPNLLAMPSVMMSTIQESMEDIQKIMSGITDRRLLQKQNHNWVNQRIVEELYALKDRTQKDALVATYMEKMEEYGIPIFHDSRIVPAIFYQPHFYNIKYRLDMEKDTGNTKLYSEQYEEICRSPLLRSFKYIKTFTPLRRFTTSHGATVKFGWERVGKPIDEEDGTPTVIPDWIFMRVLNRSFMIDWQERLFKDSILVRFEDGKLNPVATFTALAAFLDIPYTSSMTYCSIYGSQDRVVEGNVKGFDPATVYRTYDEYINNAERVFIEYFFRDAYSFYGYDCQYYNGEEFTETDIIELMNEFTTHDKYMRDSWLEAYKYGAENDTGLLEVTKEVKDAEGNTIILRNEEIENYQEAKNMMLDNLSIAKNLTENHIKHVKELRVYNAKLLLKVKSFFNRNGQPLRMMPKLELDPELLEQPLYH